MGLTAHDVEAARIDTRSAVEMNMLFDQINGLLAAPNRRPIEEIEHTLTDGYATALALEGERWRIERRIGEVAASLARGDAANKAKELTSLAQRLETSDGELTRLRAALADLRRVAEAARV
jgi:hypothetical protein